MSGVTYHTSAPSIGDALRGLRSGRHMERTSVPVWRNSYDADDERCRRYVHPVDESEMGAVMSAVEEYADQTKGAGKRCGELRTWGVKVYRYLWQESKRNKGLCCPSHRQIADGCRIAMSTVKATLDALYKAGFIEWIRRTVADDGDGPPRKQTSNLYRFVLPKAVAWRVSKYMVRKFGRKPGVPRSIAAALSAADLTARALCFVRDQVGRERKRRPLIERISPLYQDPSLSPPSRLS